MQFLTAEMPFSAKKGRDSALFCDYMAELENREQ